MGTQPYSYNTHTPIGDAMKNDGNKRGDCGDSIDSSVMAIERKGLETRKRRKGRNQQKTGSCPVSIADVQIRIPRHSSVLSHPWFIYHQRCVFTDFLSAIDAAAAAAAAAMNDKTDHKHCDERSAPSWSPSLNLHVDCYRPGVLWRGLLPMLFALSNDTASGIIVADDETRNEEQGIRSGLDTDAASTSPRSNPILCGGETEATAVLTGTNPSIATSLSIPQRAVLGLGLKNAAKQQFRAMAIFRGSEALPTREDTGNTAKYTGYCQHHHHHHHHQEQQQSDSGGDHDVAPSELFYERKVRIHLGPIDRNGIQGRVGRNHRPAESSMFAAGSTRFTVCLYIYPPLVSRSDIDRTLFATIVSTSYRNFLMQHACSAWCSTLGGGYFGIKDLAQSLWLSWYQRTLAIYFGDIQTARQCTVNEAYNWMYAGRFRQAAIILRNLEQEVATTRSIATVATTKRESAICNTQTSTKRSDNQSLRRGYYTAGEEKIIQHCRTARQCLHRLKTLSQKGLEKYQRIKPTPSSSSLAAPDIDNFVSRTSDDFHRFRVVSC